MPTGGGEARQFEDEGNLSLRTINETNKAWHPGYIILEILEPISISKSSNSFTNRLTMADR
jgi:hypothetical protein